jgi:hypothetical protein
MQYVLNMEIERYTLATGETGGHRLHPLLEAVGANLRTGAILPNAFPGWATGGADAVHLPLRLSAASPS